MAAEIRSSIATKPTVDNASRDDLEVSDTVTLEAVPPATGTTWAWTLVYVPEGSTAVLVPPAGTTTSGPVTFGVDKVGPYLARLVVDAGLSTESSQYVRLRALTTGLGLHLVAAGERRDASGVIPVDVDVEGWANEQNSNLLALEAASGHDTERYIAFNVDQSMLSGTSPDAFSAAAHIPDNAYVTEVSILASTAWDGNNLRGAVGDGATANRYMVDGDSTLVAVGRYFPSSSVNGQIWDQNTSGGALPMTLTLSYATVGTTGALTVIVKYVSIPSS